MSDGCGRFVFDNAVFIIHIEAPDKGIINSGAFHTAILRDILIVTNLVDDGRVFKLPVQGVNVHRLCDRCKHNRTVFSCVSEEGSDRVVLSIRARVGFTAFSETSTGCLCSVTC